MMFGGDLEFETVNSLLAIFSAVSLYLDPAHA